VAHVIEPSELISIPSTVCLYTTIFHILQKVSWSLLDGSFEIQYMHLKDMNVAIIVGNLGGYIILIRTAIALLNLSLVGKFTDIGSE